jgi:phosphoribosylglycinamide formyltransferase-1
MEDRRLTRVTKICLALPETTREVHNNHGIFKVRKKVFTYFLDNHHDDGIVAVNCKVLKGDNTRLIESEPQKFYMPAYIGSRGWVGLRLDRGAVDWDEVSELIKGSYLLCAPKTLAARVTLTL